MKRFILVLLLVSVVSRAEDHSGAAAGGAGRSDLGIEQVNKLNDMISTCLAGRPIPPSISTTSDTGGAGGGIAYEKAGVPIERPIQFPPNDIQEPSKPTPTGGNSANGAMIYQSRCIPCHSANAKAPALTSQPKDLKIADVNSGRMPKDGALSETEKADIIAFFNTLTE